MLAGIRDTLVGSLWARGLAPAVSVGGRGVIVGRLALNSTGGPAEVQRLWIGGAATSTAEGEAPLLAWHEVTVVPAWSGGWKEADIARLIVQGAALHVGGESEARDAIRLLADLLDTPNLSACHFEIRDGRIDAARSAAPTGPPASGPAAPFASSPAGRLGSDPGGPADAGVLLPLTGIQGTFSPVEPPQDRPGPSRKWQGRLTGVAADGSAAVLDCHLVLQTAAGGTAATVEGSVEVRIGSRRSLFHLAGPADAPAWERDSRTD